MSGEQDWVGNCNTTSFGKMTGNLYVSGMPAVDQIKIREPDMNISGWKYFRTVQGAIGGKIDVYAVIETFGVTCPARQHAIKKLLCSGLRGKGDVMQDLTECRDAIERAIQMEESRTGNEGSQEGTI